MTPTQQDIERVARAIHEDDGYYAWEDETEHQQEWYRNLAKSALSALKEAPEGGWRSMEGAKKRFWFDTEFIEDGRTIDLISIGIVSATGREYYAESAECDLSRASPWVCENVLPHLREQAKPRAQIAHEIVEFVGEKPEFWAYYADYDWIALCQLYGTMMDLPKGWPMFCMDVKQLAVMRGNPVLPKQDNGEHDALADARWTREVWRLLAAPSPPLPAEPQGDGNRPLPFDRDTLGRMVREAWVRWAQTQPNPKPSWLVSYDELAESDKEADRQIGEAVARWTLIGDAAAQPATERGWLSEAVSSHPITEQGIGVFSDEIERAVAEAHALSVRNDSAAKPEGRE